MTNREKISVIIPVYNSEKYLDKCLESVINQSYENLEIIIIDDGSIDNSPKICDDYAKKDKRIIVKHIINGGVSAARNIGLTIATGKFVGFVDSDDWIDKDMYYKLFNSLKDNNSDISCCNYMINDNQNSYKFGDSVFSGKKDILNSILSEPVYWINCNKLYNRELINNKLIKFNEKIGLGEDGLFTFEFIDSSSSNIKLSYLDEQLYHYRKDEYNNKKDKYIKKYDGMIDAYSKYLQILNKYNVEASSFKIAYLCECVNYKYLLKKTGQSNAKIIEVENVINNIKNSIDCSTIKIRDKVKYLLATKLPSIYQMFKNK